MLALLLTFLACGHAFAQQDSPANSVRFRTVDIYVDAGGKSLAAYQVEFSASGAGARIVGIEGGEHAAFSQPPFYDPKAMQQERAVIAAFNTNAPNELPAGKTRVATVHLQIRGAAEPGFRVTLQTAADMDGVRIGAETSVEERKKP